MVTTALSNSGRSLTWLEKLKMDVTALMRQCDGKTAPTKALVKGLATELDYR
jgi:hypothetical protein